MVFGKGVMDNPGGNVASESARTSYDFRWDVQGLRAIAVLGVLLFHAQLPMPGGFLGVDVFFAISGYVISGLLLKNSDGPGGLSWSRFYTRRFLRLGPALSVMVVVALALSYLVSSPFGVQQATGYTAIGAQLLSANFVLAALAGDYFAAPAQYNLLLHTWSLSVEEQIYLIVPVLILILGWVVRWHVKRSLIAIFLAVGGASLALTIAAATDHIPLQVSPLVGYFSPVTRFWEFAAGGLVACFGARVILRERLASFLVAAGLAVIVLSFLVLNETYRYPGPWTLVPVMGTVVVLWAGRFTSRGATRLLAAKPLAWVGDRSYSIYLWHWPLVVVAFTLWPSRLYAPFAATLLSVGVAILAYRWWEQPFRRLATPGPRPLLALVGVFVAVPLIGAVLLVRSADSDWQTRWNSMPLGSGMTLTDGFPQCSVTFRSSLGSATDRDIFCASTTDSPALAIVGDSHASVLMPGFESAQPSQGVMVTGVAGFPVSDSRFRQVFQAVADAPNITDVIITYGWEFQGLDEPLLESAVRELVRSGKRVFILSDVPTFVGDPLRCLVSRLPIGDDTCSIPIGQVRGVSASINIGLSQVASNVEGATFVDTREFMCGKDSCSLVYDGVPVYSDNHHLNPAGARIFVSRLLQEVPTLLDRRPAAPMSVS